MNGGQQIHEPGAVGSQIRDSTHANVAQGNQPIKVLIVDDVEVAREAYRRLLRDSSEIRIVGEATNGLEAIEQFDKLMPDVAIMDINMPVLNGLSATEEICKRHPKAKIIICSVQSDPMYKRRASLSGAKEYIEIPPLQTELVDAIRRVVGRGTP